MAMEHRHCARKQYRRQRQLPAWKSSDGKLCDRQDVGKNLTGYEPSEKEKAGGKNPKPVGEVKNAYGSVSVGVAKSGGKGSLMLVVSRSKSKDGPQLTEEDKKLNAERAVRLRPARGVYLTGSHDPEKGAFSYKEDLQMPPYVVKRKMKALVRGHKYEALRQMLPFLSTKQEESELRELAGEEREQTESGGPVPQELLYRKEEVRAEIARKEEAERRFMKHLELTIEKAKGKAALARAAVPQWFGEPVADAGETPPDTEAGAPPEDSAGSSAHEDGNSTAGRGAWRARSGAKRSGYRRPGFAT